MRDLRALNLGPIIDLAVRNMYASLDERQDYMPFFTYRLFATPPCIEHSYDSPHVVGRYLHSLSRIKRAFGRPINLDLVRGMQRRLYQSLRIGEENGLGLAWNEGRYQVAGAVTHNLREAILGLLGLANLLGSEEAIDRAARLVRDIARHMNGSGRFPVGLLTRSGWESFPAMDDATPAQSGRLVGSLLTYYRLTADGVAIDLAQQIARLNAATCFAEDGTWKAEAGTHVHSITGMITGLLDLGFFLGDAALIRTAKAAFDHGLSPYRSSFGWVKEMRDAPFNRGEANNSGDILESAILLARNLDNSYWDAAERILRNHLIASQLTNPDWFHSDRTKADTDQWVYRDAAERAIGGFFFSSPADCKSHDQDTMPINNDLVGGATQALCEADESAVEDNGRELRVNLLLSRDTPTCEIVSSIPEKGQVSLILREPRAVWLRIPASAPRSSVRVAIDGETRAAPWWVGPWIRLSEKPRRISARVEFELSGSRHQETITGETYSSEWLGDTVVSVKGPKKFFKELY